MIRSFADRELERLIAEGPGPRTRSIPAELYRTIARKVGYLNQAGSLTDLRVPPGNRLEPLKGDLAGSYSIRVNDRYRLVFRWSEGDVFDLRLMDYH